MESAITKLLSISSPKLRDSCDQRLPNCRWGRLGDELTELLEARNGFYAYESALLVRPFQSTQTPLGILEWNSTGLWKGQYGEDASDALFFADDVFGGQFCIRGKEICVFEPETGLFEAVADSLEAWARDVLAEPDFRTGYPLAHAWQVENGPLPQGVRLLPKMPFLCGGKYELENLYTLSDVEGMLFRASIAKQIRDLPDGSKIVFRTGTSKGT